MKLRQMQARDGKALDALYAMCHPTWPARPEGWWWAHPTLVLTDGKWIIGATSFTVSLAPAAEILKLLKWDRAEVGWGHGVYVHAGDRGKGYGWKLAEARHAMLRRLGVEFFFGQTQPDNAPMIAIFERQQLTRGVTIPDIYHDGEAGVLYHGRIV